MENSTHFYSYQCGSCGMTSSQVWAAATMRGCDSPASWKCRSTRVCADKLVANPPSYTYPNQDWNIMSCRLSAEWWQVLGLNSVVASGSLISGAADGEQWGSECVFIKDEERTWPACHIKLVALLGERIGGNVKCAVMRELNRLRAKQKQTCESALWYKRGRMSKVAMRLDHTRFQNCPRQMDPSWRKVKVRNWISFPNFTFHNPNTWTTELLTIVILTTYVIVILLELKLWL